MKKCRGIMLIYGTGKPPKPDYQERQSYPSKRKGTLVEHLKKRLSFLSKA